MNTKSTSFKLEAAVAVFAGLFLTIGIFSAGFVGNIDNVRAESVGIQQTPTPKTKNKPAPEPTVSPTPCPSPDPTDPNPVPCPPASPTPTPTMMP
jgi:hypothetical protein